MNKFAALTSVVLLTGVAATSRADFLLNLNTVINTNGAPPGSPYTFMTALFQTVGTDTVDITLSNLMPSSHFISYFNFNLNPAVGATYLNSLSISYVSGNKAIEVNREWNGLNEPNDLKAGYFDLQLRFPPPPGSSPDVFSGGESSKYRIIGTGLTAESFRFASIPEGNNPGGYYGAAKVQGYGNSASIGATGFSPPPGGNSVPEPFTMSLGVAAAGVFVRRRMKAKKA